MHVTTGRPPAAPALAAPALVALVATVGALARPAAAQQVPVPAAPSAPATRDTTRAPARPAQRPAQRPVVRRPAPFDSTRLLPPPQLLGGGDDATLPRRGELRVRADARFSGWDETFGRPGESGASTRRPFGARFTLDSLGPTQLEALRPGAAALRTLTGSATTPFSLGRLEARARATTFVTPITAEVGLLRRIALQVGFSPVRNRYAIQAIANPGGTDGNLGLNPARFGGNLSASQTTNQQLQAAFTAAIAAIEQQLANGTASDPAAARALRADALRAQNALRDLYGTGTAGTGSPAVPLANSAEQALVVQQIRALSGRFEAFGVTALPATLAPAGATARIGAAGLRTLTNDPAFLIRSDSLRTIPRQGIGDLEAALGVTWLDTFGSRGDASRTADRFDLPRGLAIRSTVWGGYRLAIGALAPANFLTVLPVDRGASGPVLRSFTDVSLGSRVLATIGARALLPTARDVEVRIPEFPGQAFVAAYRTQTVRWTPGRELQLEVTPRVRLTRQIALVGQVALQDRSADAYAGAFTLDSATTGVGPRTFDAAILGEGTAQRATRVSYGVSYSTMPAWVRGRSRIPAEVAYLHTTTVAGTGGATPRVVTDAITLRIYAPLFGPAVARRR